MSNVQITPAHLARKAAIYIRQSSPGQVLHNKESQRLQYGLAERAVSLGWPRSQVLVIDEDLGVSGRGGGITRMPFHPPFQHLRRVCAPALGPFHPPSAGA